MDTTINTGWTPDNIKPATGQQLVQLKNAGLTLIMATHDLALAMELCERALVLSEDHRLLVDGEISEIIGDAAFLSTANLVNPLS